MENPPKIELFGKPQKLKIIKSTKVKIFELLYLKF